MSRSRMGEADGTAAAGFRPWPVPEAVTMPAAPLSARTVAAAYHALACMPKSFPSRGSPAATRRPELPRRQFGGARYGNEVVTFGESKLTLSVVSCGVA